MTKRNASTSNAPRPAPKTGAAPPRTQASGATRVAPPVRRPLWRRLRVRRLPLGPLGRLAGANGSAVAVIVTSLVVLAVLGLLGYGYWDAYIRPARMTAVEVGDTTYSTLYFTRRLKASFNEPGAALRSGQQIADTITKLGNDIGDEEVLIQRAPSLGVHVPDGEIDGFMAERLAIPFSRNEAGEIVYSRTFENGVRTRLQGSGLTLEEYRRAIHGQRLRQEVRKHFDNSIPEALPAVRLRQISLPDEEQAKDARRRLDSGASFDDLAVIFAASEQSALQGGLRDWTPTELLPDEIGGAVKDLSIGQVAGPMESGKEWVLVKVEDRTETRQITDKERTTLGGKKFDAWLAAQRAEMNVRTNLEDRKVLDYAVKRSGALELLSEGMSGGQGLPGQLPGGIPNIPGGVPVAPAPGAPPAGGGGR